MSNLFETARPRPSSSARVRIRRNGTPALHDPTTGRTAELGADQATLLPLLDGQRSLAEVAERHFATHRFIPFTALNDLLSVLERTGLLEGGRPIRDPPSVPLRAGGPVTLGLALAAIGGAIALGLTRAAAPLSAWDVLWALPGAVLALCVRELFRAAVATLGGAPPARLFLRLHKGLPSLAPDSGGLVLLDRPLRALALFAGLLGAALAAWGTLPLSRGLAFGALVVLVADLCPFAPTSAGRLLATLAGRVDLREHARAYLSRRFLRRAATSATFEGEGSLILSSLLSLLWLGMTTRLLLTRGVIWVVELLAEAADAPPPERALALAGASLLVLSIPVFLALLLWALWRAAASLLPERAGAGATGQRDAGQLELSGVPLFARLPEAEQAALASAAVVRRYPAGAPVVVQGERGDTFYAVLSGEAAVEREEESGLRHEVARLSAGDCFGEAALLEGGVRAATVRARSDLSVLALVRADFERARAGLDAPEVTHVLRASAALRKSAFFGRMGADRVSALALRLRPLRAGANEVVVKAGDRGTDFFLVAEGQLDVVAEDGSALATLGPGDHFGEVALLRDVPRVATVRTRGEARLLALDKETFLRALAQDLALGAQLESLASARAGEAR